MPIAENPARAGGRVLLDASGTEIARFVATQREGLSFADLFELSDRVSAERAVPLVLEALAGWRVAAAVPFGRMLAAAGGTPRRHGYVMSRDLVRDPPPPSWLEPPVPTGVRLTPVDRPAIDLAPACFAAYPQDHVDYGDIPTPERPELELEEIISGRLMGPLLRCSGLAVGEDGSVLAAILVNATAGDPPFRGPWVTQIFRHPDSPRGTGAALLRRAVALAGSDGLPAIGLAVTHGNPGRGVYAASGFRDVSESLNVDLPLG